jgi:hypothetical protein
MINYSIWNFPFPVAYWDVVPFSVIFLNPSWHINMTPSVGSYMRITGRTSRRQRFAFKSGTRNFPQEAKCICHFQCLINVSQIRTHNRVSCSLRLHNLWNWHSVIKQANSKVQYMSWNFDSCSAGREISHFYGTQRLIIVSTTAHNWICPDPVQFCLSRHNLILILSSAEWNNEELQWLSHHADKESS